MNYQAIDILLVDDSAQDEELAIRVLKEGRIANAIMVAHDGQEALDMLFSGAGGQGRLRPKLIVLDLKLPKIDGLEVLRRIKSDPRTRATPVVVLSSSQQESDRIKSYALGVNSYVVKPISFEDFRKAVKLLGLYWLMINQPPVLKEIDESQ